eukprot:Phypoly_transcript_10996.p1 GENE.Phypoly_transcript_10996~~Phypoly_transcript_10996.p1  ORF type:complete len:367 (-),score=77.78 Phypoly_transcript_10996:64-1164(-)
MTHEKKSDLSDMPADYTCPHALCVYCTRDTRTNRLLSIITHKRREHKQNKGRVQTVLEVCYLAQKYQIDLTPYKAYHEVHVDGTPCTSKEAEYRGEDRVEGEEGGGGGEERGRTTNKDTGDIFELSKNAVKIACTPTSKNVLRGMFELTEEGIQQALEERRKAAAFANTQAGSTDAQAGQASTRAANTTSQADITNAQENAHEGMANTQARGARAQAGQASAQAETMQTPKPNIGPTTRKGKTAQSTTQKNTKKRKARENIIPPRQDAIPNASIDASPPASSPPANTTTQQYFYNTHTHTDVFPNQLPVYPHILPPQNQMTNPHETLSSTLRTPEQSEDLARTQEWLAQNGYKIFDLDVTENNINL